MSYRRDYRASFGAQNQREIPPSHVDRTKFLTPSKVHRWRPRGQNHCFRGGQMSETVRAGTRGKGPSGGAFEQQNT